LIVTDMATNSSAPTLVPAESAPTLVQRPDVQSSPRNADVGWDSFLPDVYWENNYRTLRNDDQSIIEAVGGFFSRHFRNTPRAHSLRGLDVGSGGNLYPALAMLPWSATITLTDLSTANVAWLQVAAGPGTVDDHGRWVWQPFWAEYARYPTYQQVGEPRAELAIRHEVRQVDVLALEPARWDLGTMFFVAESITTDPDEFAAATLAFGRALVPGAPFATAFMDSAVGYSVADQYFPAVRAVNVDLVRAVIEQFSDDVVVERVDVPAHDPESDGYEGMIVAVGTIRPDAGGLT
jgi:hypothetical protein